MRGCSTFLRRGEEGGLASGVSGVQSLGLGGLSIESFPEAVQPWPSTLIFGAQYMLTSAIAAFWSYPLFVLQGLVFGVQAQRLQNPLTKEHTLNYKRNPNRIYGIFRKN